MKRESAARNWAGKAGSVRVDGLSKRYPGSSTYAVRNLTITVESGRLYSLLGPSGCGKTTTMRCIAGLETPDEGEIWINDTLVFSSERGINVPPFRRGVGMVFQSYAIWPHMTVFENVAYPLKRAGLKRDDIEREVLRTLDLVGLGKLATRPAPLLSGGEQQRVALARALVGSPRVVLLDEPLSNLDAQLRNQTRAFIRDIQQNLGITALYVTHDQDEAFALSDTMAVMNAGRIEDLGPPDIIYNSPASPFAASFVGESTQIEGLVVGHDDGHVLVDSPIGVLRCRSRHRASKGQRTHVFLRPEEVELIGRADDLGACVDGSISGTIESVIYQGATVTWFGTVNGVRIQGSTRANSAEGRLLRSETRFAAIIKVAETSCVPAPGQDSSELKEEGKREAHTQLG